MDSRIFARAPNLALFLTYVCGKYFDGESDRIKEYNIAVEALGRPPDFDQREDAIVRVEAFRLRKRLNRYYENEGAGHEIQISIPPGQYVPQFIWRKIKAEPPSKAVVPVTGVEQTVTIWATTLPAPEALPTQRVMKRRTVVIAAVLGAIALVTATVLVTSRLERSRRPAAGVAGTQAELDAALTGEDGIRILAGSPVARHVDREGKLWTGDRYFTGGRAVRNPADFITRAPDRAVFQTHREGNFRYDIPLKPGVYELRLHFAETKYGLGNISGGGEASRVFDVRGNGQLLLREFDVLSDAGGANIADIKVFKDISPDRDGMLHLEFANNPNQAFLSALEVLPAVRGRIHPVRIVAQDVSYTDQQGRIWGPDRFFTSGQMVSRHGPIVNSPDPAIYRGERYGNFSYTIPVAKGRYTLTLRFAETWFGPGKPAQGGAGSRLFDVYCNGVALLKHFDVFKEAGGSDRAIDRMFQRLEPNAQDKFVLSFVPVKNYACVNAIEVQ